MFHTHDDSPTGVQVDNYLQIGVLGYADDAALASASITTMSKRLTNIAEGSEEDADMTLHCGKTKSMIVERQDPIQRPSEEQIKVTETDYKHECEFCGRHFKISRGCRIHKVSCQKWHGLIEEEFEVEQINEVFGTPKDRWFHVQWSGHAPGPRHLGVRPLFDTTRM